MFEEVWNGRILLGTFGQSAGLYRYYEGAHHQMNASITDPDLENLKRQIEARYGR